MPCHSQSSPQARSPLCAGGASVGFHCPSASGKTSPPSLLAAGVSDSCCPFFSSSFCPLSLLSDFQSAVDFFQSEPDFQLFQSPDESPPDFFQSELDQSAPDFFQEPEAFLRFQSDTPASDLAGFSTSPNRFCRFARRSASSGVSSTTPSKGSLAGFPFPFPLLPDEPFALPDDHQAPPDSASAAFDPSARFSQSLPWFGSALGSASKLCWQALQQ
mmetsp:Transcript_46839/g.111454  ORF Transcript_46839/g.111454 Transcript_46839/m.111454 type:complete len:216 (+) Transcript_46839:113-760(+)